MCARWRGGGGGGGWLTRLLSMVMGRKRELGWHLRLPCLTISRVMLALLPRALHCTRAEEAEAGDGAAAGSR